MRSMVLGLTMAGGALLLFAGCGSSDDGGSTGPATGGTGATGGSAGASSGGSGGGDPLAQCKAEAAQNPDPACANCACDNCLDELAACEADPTCVALRNCAQGAGCCDDICVATNCLDEITAAGGLQGEGTARARAIADCTEQNTCNCC